MTSGGLLSASVTEVTASDGSAESPESTASAESTESTATEAATSNDDDDDSESSVTDTQESTSTAQVFHSLQPLTESQIQSAIEKGYAEFEGRSLSFSYPKSWYFTWLGNGEYGFTDNTAFSEYNNEVVKSNARLLVIVGELTEPCVYSKTKVIESIEYTVCAREPGLEKIVSAIADSIRK